MDQKNLILAIALSIGILLTFNLLVNKLHWIKPDGLGTALTFAACYWLFAVIVAVAWLNKFKIGPLEWVYRRFSD